MGILSKRNAACVCTAANSSNTILLSYLESCHILIDTEQQGGGCYRAQQLYSISIRM